jgi:hypothetical protein
VGSVPATGALIPPRLRGGWGGGGGLRRAPPGSGRCPITCSPHPTRARIPAQSSLRRLRKLVCDASHPPPLRVGGISACAARLVSIIVAIVIQAGSIAAGIFSGARAPHSGPPGKPRGVKRREAPVRNAAPVARPADGPVPCGTPIHHADRRAFRRFTAAILRGACGCRTDLGPRLPPGARCSGGPAGSQRTGRNARRAGPRGLPSARLTRPNPQAPHPAPSISVTG